MVAFVLIRSWAPIVRNVTVNTLVEHLCSQVGRERDEKAGRNQLASSPTGAAPRLPRRSHGGVVALGVGLEDGAGHARSAERGALHGAAGERAHGAPEEGDGQERERQRRVRRGRARTTPPRRPAASRRRRRGASGPPRRPASRRGRGRVWPPFGGRAPKRRLRRPPGCCRRRRPSPQRARPRGGS
jgi:hypothetical protein